ncbi:MAG TPA: tetratricopeptide repeat protein [Micropepsaceae bacterium]|jgi:predicted nicotinamide N-methyase|nr:tetratricopeptide repeat protein [Micropepsaceae bacterium]
MSDNDFKHASDEYRAGNHETAAALLRRYLDAVPLDASANHLLARIYHQQGKLVQSREHLAKACSTSGASPEMFINYGGVLKALGDSAGAMAAYKRALALEPNHAEALNNIGAIYIDRGEKEKAIEVLRRAVALKPEFTTAQFNLRNAYKDIVPPWHFAMMNDHVRNNAYQEAIARVVPGKHVLDIGTGSGLLAMMAARAGAMSVTSCEANPTIADQAREIIALNGLSQRIKVIAKHSGELVVGRDLACRAQVLITETFSSDLLSEGILSTIQHAHRELLTDNAILVPHSVHAKAYVTGGPDIEAMLFAGRTNGFDLSPFNNFAPPIYPTTLTGKHVVLSDDFELFAFDLRSKQFQGSSREITVPITRSGIACVVAQWIQLHLNDITVYENRPSLDSQADNHWTHILHRFPRPIAVSAGGAIKLSVGHNRQQIWVVHKD